MKSLVLFGLLVLAAYESATCPINHDEQLAESLYKMFQLAELPFSREHIHVHLLKTRFLSLQLAKKHGGFAKVSKLLDLKDRLFSVPTNDPLGPRLHAYIDVLVEIRAILKSRHASDVELIYLDESITVLRAIRHSPRHEKAVKILDYIMKQLHHDLTGEQAMVKFSMAIVAAYSAGEEVNLNPTDLIMDMADSVMRVPLNFLADKYNEMAFSVRRIDDTLDKSGNETRRPIKDLINLLPIVMY